MSIFWLQGLQAHPGDWWVSLSLMCWAGLLLGLTALWVRKHW